MMRNPGFKIFLASALGAFIGSLVGLQLNHLFWWVGMLVGGVVGYIAYEAKAIVRATPMAYRQACSQLGRIGPSVVKRLRRTASSMLQYSIWMLVIFAAGVLWAGPAVLLIVGVTGYNFAHSLAQCLPGHQGWLSMAAILVLLTLAMGTCLAIFAVDRMERTKDKDNATLFKWMFLKFSLVAVLCYWLPRGLVATVRGAIHGVVFAAVFLWKLFKLIHSDLRLLCGVDAAIGSAIGVLAHNPLLGAIVGGLFGLANYELVSKRWLKLVRV